MEWRTLVCLVVYVGFGVCGDLLLSRGMRRMPSFTGWSGSEASRFFRHVFSTPDVLGGIACLALNFAALLTLLSWADISLVGPSRAASYLILALVARWLLHERVTWQRWAGVTLITLGVALTLASEGGAAGP